MENKPQPLKIGTEWQSPSNIALVKYWGKKEGQIPANPSLSMTLSKTLTRTSVTASESINTGDQLIINGSDDHPFRPKLIMLLKEFRKEFPELEKYAFQVKTSNTFPHSAGIASSASGISAFTLCLLSIIKKITGKDFPGNEFFQTVSRLARMGSGSACRSVYGGFSVWGETPGAPGTSDLFAVPINDQVHPDLQNLRDAILIVSSTPKEISSSSGHELMNTHPFSSARSYQAGNNMKEILASMKTNDLEKLAMIAENEALTLHSLIMTSAGNPILMEPGTVSILKKVRQARKNGLHAFFSLDAGPNVHMFYPGYENKKAENFIREELIPFCEDGRVIFDLCGSGPVQILNEKNPAE